MWLFKFVGLGSLQHLRPRAVQVSTQVTRPLQ
jgi:hypothetical protein